MASYNKVLLMGNLTRDPEMRYTPKGTAITNLDMAVNRTYTTDSGEQKDEVTYVNDIEVWGRQAETSQKYLSKGSAVFIEGRLRLDSWEDKETKQKRNRLKIVAERVQFMSAPRNAEFQGGEEGGAAPAGETRRPRPKSTAPSNEEPAPAEPAPVPKDDIPF